MRGLYPFETCILINQIGYGDESSTEHDYTPFNEADQRV
jgi:hypothetical protein